jgi:hypothetical protein
MTVSRRIQILERGIEQSRKDLEEVEEALKERSRPAEV